LELQYLYLKTVNLSSKNGGVFLEMTRPGNLSASGGPGIEEKIS
jgi:hypothetical protein